MFAELHHARDSPLWTKVTKPVFRSYTPPVIFKVPSLTRGARIGSSPPQPFDAQLHICPDGVFERFARHSLALHHSRLHKFDQAIDRAR